MKELPLLRTSERGTYKRCHFAHNIEFNMLLRPTGKGPPALRFGSLVHAALEKFYRPGLKRGPRPASTFEKLYQKDLLAEEKNFGMVVEDEWRDAGELGVAMLEHYYETYGKDSRYKVIATEQTFQVPVKINGKTAFYYVGTVDGVW